MARGRGELTPLDKKYKRIVSNNLIELAHVKHLRQADIVRSSGLAKSTVNGYFKGLSLPTQRNLIKLATALNVSPSEIDPRYGKKSSDNEVNSTPTPQNIAEEKMLVAFRKQTAGMSEDDQIKFQRSLNKLMDAAKDLNSLGE